MNLSPHFTLEEMIRSSTAEEEGIDNTPTPAVVDALRVLCEKVLEPLREGVGRPVLVTSGFRCEALNVAVRGSTKSQHTKGQAADIQVPGLSMLEVGDWIRRHLLEWDQLIYERNARGAEWIHVSYVAVPGRNRRMVLRKTVR